MLNFFKKDPVDDKSTAQTLYEKVLTMKTDSHEGRNARLRLGMLSKVHLDKTFVAGAEMTAHYIEQVAHAAVNGKEHPPVPEPQLFQQVKVGEKTVWAYLPEDFVNPAFILGARYQKTDITAQQAIAEMQALADQLCRYELRLDPPFTVLQFLRDELAAEQESDTEPAPSTAQQPE